MRAVIQRVTSASVEIDNKTVGSINKGLMVLLGVGKSDTEADMKYIADKMLGLRIFEDENEKMNLDVKDVGGELLIVSQFTLYGDCRKGRRPSFDPAMPPKEANELYERFVEYVKQSGLKVQTGEFGADMKVSLVNDGPVTLCLDSTKLF